MSTLLILWTNHHISSWISDVLSCLINSCMEKNLVWEQWRYKVSWDPWDDRASWALRIITGKNLFVRMMEQRKYLEEIAMIESFLHSFLIPCVLGGTNLYFKIFLRPIFVTSALLLVWGAKHDINWNCLR